MYTKRLNQRYLAYRFTLERFNPAIFSSVSIVIVNHDVNVKLFAVSFEIFPGKG